MGVCQNSAQLTKGTFVKNPLNLGHFMRRQIDSVLQATKIKASAAAAGGAAFLV